VADDGDAQGGSADALNQQRQIDNITDSARDLEIAFDVNEWKSIPAANDQLGIIIAERTCLYRKLDSAIMVMKSAEDRRRYDVAQVLDSPMDRSLLVERPMCPQFVIIGGLAPEKYNSIAHWPC
jgi:hypothetical protein